MRPRIVSLLGIMLMISIIFASPAAAGSSVGSFGRGIQPGDPITLEQRIPINIIFLGYDRHTINKHAVLDQLPETYEPVVRYPQFYGLPGRDMGLKYTYKYNFIFTRTSFENRFFDYLEDIGVTGDPTLFQQQYNDQENNVLDVTSPVLYIDAPKVEKWLVRNLKHRQGYTLVFINWYSRPDFKFHVYTKTDVVDPDTGYNFGELRESRKMIAWGGSRNSRLWFYDLSAGPEAWTDNWNVDTPDLDENGVEDYRMPPIWEYTPDGYRDPSALSSDLGLVTRFVGINLLFTSSPLYDPLATAPDRGGEKIVHINMFEDDPASQGTDWIDPGFVESKLKKFQPYYDWETKLVDRDPVDPGAQRALRIFTGLITEDDCWNFYGDPFAELFCYFDANFDMYVPDYDKADYVAAVFAYNTTGENLGEQFGLLGFADDNWMDGTQSYVFIFNAAEYRDLGYGFSWTTIHEVGHHIGMSHPHDGYDSELNLDYGPSDEFYYVWSGDESDTIMHYITLSTQFSQFDRDNMYRWETAGYLNWSSELLDLILDDPSSWKVKEELQSAEQTARQSIASFYRWDYLKAVSNARRTYVTLQKAAKVLGISEPVPMEALLVAPSMSAPHEGDPIRFPDN